MSKSLIITKQTYKDKDANYYLTLREWYFQGDRPDYTRIQEVSYQAAESLWKNGAASDHTGDFDGRNERYKMSKGKIDIPKAAPWWNDNIGITTHAEGTITFATDPITISSTTEKWDRRFLNLAELISTWSKDPSTKCGCVIVRPDRTLASVGFNGFPRGIEDKQELYDNREEKYKRVIHGEMNAILNAREPLHGYTLYTHPGPCSCERCTVHIIQAGIKRVVAANKSEDYSKRYYDQTKLSEQLYKEAGVEYEVIT